MELTITYGRKSIKPKGFVNDKESIRYQEQVMEEYALNHNMKIVARFSDIGYSGTLTQRPELIEMLEFLENSEEKVDVLLFYTVDRLGRDLKNNINLALQVSDLVKKIVFVVEGISNNYEHFKMFLILKSIVAEEERINMLNRFASARWTKVTGRKIFNGAKKPLGYIQKGDELRKATIEETKDLKEIQGLEALNYIILAYLSNQSVSQIAKNLRRNFGLTRSGKKWDKNSVTYILGNDIYAGILSGSMNGKRYEVTTNKVDPLLSNTTYEFIQARLKNTTKGRPPKKYALPLLSVCIHCLKPVSQVGPMISCPECERSMEIEDISSAVERNLTDYLLGSYSTESVERYLKEKRNNLFFSLHKYQEKVKQLEGTQQIIKSLFYDDPTELKLLLSYNREEIRQLLREQRETQSFLEFLFDQESVMLEDALTTGKNEDLYVHLPYLQLIDFERNEVYLKFHPCVFEEDA